MKVIALISGGKDSLFSILHCLANGHEVVALANLHPPAAASTAADQPADAAVEDMDSFMYQTVGHGVIPLYAEALGLPLYRQAILGAAVNTDRDYDPTVRSSRSSSSNDAEAAAELDETESLVPLLRQVLADHPDADAVSTGAILSNYQRTRVESVALRLGLVPLSYLWQYPSLPPYAPAALLEDMVAVGQDARIIKVASGGLDPGFLWANVADARTVARLTRAMARFGGGSGDGAVLGEGGEFETLAIDGPAPLWKRRIEVELAGEVIGEGGSAIMRVKGARTTEKEHLGEEGKSGIEALRIPEILDTEFKTVLDRLPAKSTASVSSEQSWGSQSISPISPISHPSVDDFTSRHGHVLSISNLTASGPSPTAQLTSILAELSARLDAHHLTSTSVVSATLLLRHMFDFATLNPVYGAFFAHPNPPARIAVACGACLPAGADVMLSVICDTAPSTRARRALHVQSRSYWAPANIGPYSQAVAVPLPPPSSPAGDTDTAAATAELVHIAGQIPLVPATMEMVTPDALRWQHPPNRFALQAVLALQHLFRIGRATGVSSFLGAVAFLGSSCCDDDDTADEATERARVAGAVWREAHAGAWRAQHPDADGEAGSDEDDDNAVDVWDLKHGRGASGSLAPATPSDPRPLLPDYGMLTTAEDGDGAAPPAFTAQVAELPRAALVEWTGVGVAGGEVRWRRARDVPGFGGQVVDVGAVSGTGFAVVWAAVEDAGRFVERARALRREEGGSRSDQVTVYVAARSLSSEAWAELPQAQIIPCERLWDGEGRPLAAVFMVRRYGA